jgi:hypothetical protein
VPVLSATFSGASALLLRASGLLAAAGFQLSGSELRPISPVADSASLPEDILRAVLPRMAHGEHQPMDSGHPVPLMGSLSASSGWTEIRGRSPIRRLMHARAESSCSAEGSVFGAWPALRGQ